MRRPLFWKILIGSWTSLILVAAGNALIFELFADAARPWAEQVLHRVGTAQVAAAARVLQLQGPGGVSALAAKLQPGERLTILPGRRPPPGRPSAEEFRLSRIVMTTSGAYTLVYETRKDRFFPPTPRSHVPLELLAVNFLAVSIFSILIAWYLVGPIHKLRAGLKRVAEGDLSVRVHAQVAHRRDEMADLARNFDLMAERLQQLLQARERLLHDVSHEFRSPLTRLLLAVELVRRDPERSRASLERIEHEAQRLNEMVGELLTLSRAEFSAARSETFFALADLVAQIAADATFEADAKGVAVTYEQQGAAAIIKGSPELMRKGIDNALRNAVKASKAGQTVTVRLVQPVLPGARLRIEISDQGPGVPEDDLERIFEPFVRLDGQPQGSGFGLGLAIARSAAQAHNGEVWASNVAPRGLTVVFDLPADTNLDNP